MNANKSVAHRLGRVLEKVTQQSGRLSGTPEYGSWLLGKVSENQRRRRVRIQVILTVLILVLNVIGVAVSFLLVTVVIPVPSIFTDAPRWITFAVSPAYFAVALALGMFWITRRTVGALRWAIEERKPTRQDQRNTFLAPWRVAKAHLILWGVGAVAADDALRFAEHRIHPAVHLLCRVSRRCRGDGCYLITEFALRPVAAQALEAGPLRAGSARESWAER